MAMIYTVLLYQNLQINIKILFIKGIMAVWLVAGIATTIFIVLYDTEDFRERLNMMQPPELPYKLTVIGCMVINLLFCYIWEVSPKYQLKTRAIKKYSKNIVRVNSS